MTDLLPDLLLFRIPGVYAVSGAYEVFEDSEDGNIQGILFLRQPLGVFTGKIMDQPGNGENIP